MNYLRLTGLIFLLLIIWFLRLVVTRPTAYKGPVENLYGTVTEVEEKGSGEKVRVSNLKLGEQKLSGSLLLTTHRHQHLSWGDEIAVSGNLEVPRQFQIYRGISATAAFPEIQILSPHQGSSFYAKLFQLRQNLEALISKLLPEPQASLLSGILLGSKKALPPDFAEALRKTGTTHIVVASGFNISVVAGVFVSIAKLLSPTLALPLSLAGIWFYTLLVGFTPPVVRAAIMGSLAFLGKSLGRQKDTILAIFVAAALMLIASPYLLWDLSFQLSFLATAGLVFIAPFFSRFFGRLPELVRGNLSETLAAQAATFPLIFVKFGEYSIWSPLVNVLVGQTVAPLTYLGMTLVALGSLWQPLGRLIAFLAWPLLTYFVKVVRLFG